MTLKSIFFKKLNSIFIATVAIFCLWLWHAFSDTTITITPLIQEWTYNNAIKVELLPSESNAKIFYSFDPNWTPNDLFAYTWAILITKTTPLVFFWYTDIKNESKIEILNYTIDYPKTIRLKKWAEFDWSKISWLTIENIWGNQSDISLWSLKSDFWNYEIPFWTALQAWWELNIDSISWTWFISLFAPDWEKIDFIEVGESLKSWTWEEAEQEKKVAVTYPKKTVKKTNTVAYNPTAKTAQEISTPVDSKVNIETSTWVTEDSGSIDTKNETNSWSYTWWTIENVASNKFTDSLKTSAIETKSDWNSRQSIYIIASILIIWIWFGLFRTIKSKI